MKGCRSSSYDQAPDRKLLSSLSLSCLTVGNIPYDKSEEQLAEIFSEVGKVVEFRLIFDNDTGKPKGYGFCEFEGESSWKGGRRAQQLTSFAFPPTQIRRQPPQRCGISMASLSVEDH